MTDSPDNLNLTAHTSRHRSQRRGLENGTVRKTGQRVSKWLGIYHVYLQRSDGTERRDKREIILGTVSEMGKSEAKDALRVFIRRRNSYLITQGLESEIRQALLYLADPRVISDEVLIDEVRRRRLASNFKKEVR
jgi:hypothetical protein